MKDVIGESSPVQQFLKQLRAWANDKPMPNANTEQSRSASVLILVHLLGLCDSVGHINCLGYHSAAITLLRAVEDATDCFAAVSLDADASKKWFEGKLKSSDAAKIWTTAVNIEFESGFKLGDYRKTIRNTLNKYSHCSPNQANWNIYLETIGKNKCSMELNIKPLVISLNAYYIDRYLCAHLYEIIGIILSAFSEYFKINPSTKKQFIILSKEIKNIVDEFLESINSSVIDISIAPEIARLSKHITPC